MSTYVDLERRVHGSVGEARLASLIEHIRMTVFADPSRRERLHALFLDRQRSLLADDTFGRGSPAALSVRMRDLFARALSLRAHGLIIAHNHPSGDCRPSTADIAATRTLATIGKALDVELIDHLIITRDAVYSMRAGGDL